MSSRSASHSASASSNSGDSAHPTPTNKPPTADSTTAITHYPPSVPSTESHAMNKSSSMTAAASRIDEFVQMLLFDEQCSILRDYALHFIKLFAVYYCNSKSLLRSTTLITSLTTVKSRCPSSPLKGLSRSRHIRTSLLKWPGIVN